MVGILDYGVGNLFSLASSFRCIGQEAFVSADPRRLEQADRLVLPGVGAFQDAAAKLRASGLDGFLCRQAAQGKPLLGICLGMQLLFQESLEYGCHQGLGLLSGRVVAMEGRLPPGLKIPHMGWNRLEVSRGRLLEGLDGAYVYFVHSYYGADCDESVAAYTEYGKRVTAAVWNENVYGCQFHPEKSGEVGLKILRAFSEIN